MPYHSTKRGRAITELRRSGSGFHWVCRDDNGVSVWQGSPVSLLWGSRILAVTTTLFAVLSVGLFATGAWSGGIATACGAAIHGSLGWWMGRLRKSIEEFETEEELTQQLNVDQTEVDRMAQKYQVKPRLIVNGRPYYSAEDFDEAARLLRAASPPTEQSLLRPASNADSTERESLLRPASDSSSRNDEGITPISTV